MLSSALMLLLCLPGLGAWQQQPSYGDASLIDSQPFHPFDWDLWKVLSQSAPGNTVFSPVSVRLLLSVIYEGSYPMARSAIELARVLNLSRDRMTYRREFKAILRSLMARDPSVELHMGTRLYVNDSVVPKHWYQRILYTNYDVHVEKLNFGNASEARDRINRWVQGVTRDTIKDFLSSDEAVKASVLLLINAVYFKGAWMFPFEPEYTTAGKFRSPRGLRDVRYMTRSHYYYHSRSEKLKAQILSLPYMGNKFTMYILLPDDKDGLDDMIQRIHPRELRNLTFQMEETPLEVWIPQFKFESKTQLKGVLQKLGIRGIFESFSDMRGLSSRSEELVVSEAVQKAGIEVNEEGTVASAATEFQLVNKFGGMDEIFRAHHPFMFFIEDEFTGSVIFIGKCVDPTGTDETETHDHESKNSTATSSSSAPASTSSSWPPHLPPAKAPASGRVLPRATKFDAPTYFHP